MQKPAAVKNAEILTWISLVVSLVLAVVERKLDITSSPEFLGTLVMCGLYCIIPYKIGRGSNWSRYAYAILTAAGYALLVAGDLGETAHFEVVLAWLETPFTVLTLYWLFKPGSGAWFEKRTA